MTVVIRAKKDQLGKNWEQIAGGIGTSPVWTTSACLGMSSVPEARPWTYVNYRIFPATSAGLWQRIR